MTLYRLRIRWSALKHRMLCWLSDSYRNHDEIVLELGTARRERATVEGKLARVTVEAADLRSQLDLATEGQQNATGQLLAERALRQAAEERAEHYHDELVTALKQTNNWSALAVSRKAIFHDVENPAPPEVKQELPAAIRPKPMARNVAQQVTHETLKAVLDDIRSGRADDQPMQVGPEMSA